MENDIVLKTCCLRSLPRQIFNTLANYSALSQTLPQFYSFYGAFEIVELKISSEMNRIIFVFLTCGLLAFTGIILNALLLFAFLRSSKLRANPANQFIVAISFCELSLALLGIILKLTHENEVVFDASVVSALIVGIALANFQVGFTIDRYFAICSPMTYLKFKDTGYRKWIMAVCIMISFTWLALILLGVDIEKILILLTVSMLTCIITMLVLFILMKMEISRMVNIEQKKTLP